MDFKFEINESLWLPNALEMYDKRNKRPAVPKATLEAMTFVHSKFGEFPSVYSTFLQHTYHQTLSGEANLVDVRLDDVDGMAALLTSYDREGEVRLRRFDPRSFLFNGQTANSCARELSDIVNGLRTTSEYRLLLNEIEEYKVALELQWRGLSERIVPIMQDITRRDLDLDFTVYMLHPSTYYAKNLGGKRMVLGFKENFPNQAGIILSHEALHEVFAPRIDDMAHCVVILAADNELRVRLNGGTYPPFEAGPGYLQMFSSALESMLPAWKQYLTSSERNIIDFTAALPV